MKLNSILTLFVVLVLSVTGCKSSEMVSDGAADGMEAAEEVVTNVVEEAAPMVEENMVAQILEKHLEARGGKEKIKAIQTVTWSAGMEMMGMNMPLSVQLKRPNKMRQDIEVAAMGAKIATAFDGTVAWMVNPMNGSEEAQKMPEESAKAMQEQGAIDGAVIGYMDKGYEMTYAGEDIVHDKPAHKIEVKLPEDKMVTVYFDAMSFLEVKSVQEGQNPMTGASGEIATYSSDYREVAGVQMAHKITAEFNGELLQTFQIDTIEVNKEIPDSVFEMPGMVGSMN